MKFTSKWLAIALLLWGGAVSCQNQETPQSQSAQGGVVNVNLNVNQFAALLDSAQTEGVLLDVRTPQEFMQGHIKGAELMNFYDQDFQDNLKKLDKETPVYVYCRSGARSGNAAKMMKQMGFKSVYNLQGGMNMWQRSGQDVAK